VLVHVIDIPEPPGFLRGRSPQPDVLEDTAREGAEKKLRELSLTPGTALIWPEIRRGRPSESIATVATEYSANLVVVGTHRERPGLWNRLGTTAERLLALSPAPVLLATGVQDLNLRHVLVPVDDSNITPQVLAWARLVAAHLDAQASAIHVMSAAVQSHILSMASLRSGSAQLTKEPLQKQQLQEELRLETDRSIEQMLGAGLERQRINSEVAFGEPSQEILAAAERYRSGMIVMGRGTREARRRMQAVWRACRAR
jgi:nucleotide-binding universal stress UspA family protein